MKFSKLLFIALIAISFSSCELISSLTDSATCDFVYPISYTDVDGSLIEFNDSEEASDVISWVENQIGEEIESGNDCGEKGRNCDTEENEEEVNEDFVETLQFPLQVESFDGTLWTVNTQEELFTAFSACVAE
jgi:hypothetical protein